MISGDSSTVKCLYVKLAYDFGMKTKNVTDKGTYRL